ncbi:MAG: pilus assembly PilX N-terminal domain-containing protein [Deltaproteobacteria bacterium]|jgi:type II secretory pathway pseudopilin PulG|nr:pilus assembly PilX N-terminal domain-containing protein [Deltaproteobacteria bacterium]
MTSNDIRHEYQARSGQRGGMILITTLVIMLVITIMGAGLLFTSTVEVTTASTYRQNMVAYNYADALATLGITAIQVVAHTTADELRDHLNYSASKLGLKITVNDSLDSLNADKSLKRTSIKERYLGLGSKPDSNAPDIVVRDKNDKIVGTIMISHDFGGSAVAGGTGFTVGSSSGIGDKGSTGSGIVTKQNYVITVSGKDPVYTAQSFFDDDSTALTGPQTFITILYEIFKVN